MKMKKLFSVFVIAIIAILMVTVALGSVQAVDAAPKKVKVTWNANGGKIGTTKTTTTILTKGKKIGKLPKTPKKVGYTFKGWYTKKKAGTKITKATKVKKKITYYAQWKKGSSVSNTSRVLTEAEKKLVGVWSLSSSIGTAVMEFKSDGTYYCVVIRESYGTYYSTHTRGNFLVSGNKYILTNLECISGTKTEKPGNYDLLWKWTDNWHSISDSTKNYYYEVGTDANGKYLVENLDSPLTADNYNAKWRI